MPLGPRCSDSVVTGKPLKEQAAMLFGVGLPFVGLVAAIVLAWGRAVDWFDIGLLLALYCFTCLGVTIGFHRMFTHRALETGAILRFILGVAGSMSAQGPVLEWCAVHRWHHAHSDRDGDPHSPHLQGAGWAAMVAGMWHAHFGWLFAQDRGGHRGSVSDLVADPVLRVVDQFFWGWMVLGWVIPAAIAGVWLKSWTAAFDGFLWGGLVRTFLLHHVTWSINSVCHVWGTRPFSTPDQSRNNVVFGILAFGEGWHNNHHAFPTSARHGLRWWQIDLTYWVIRVLEATGLAWQVRLPAPVAVASGLQLPARPCHAVVD